jgi:hypothetical protein
MKTETRGGHPNCGRKKIGDCEIRLRCFESDKTVIKAFVKELNEKHNLIIKK